MNEYDSEKIASILQKDGYMNTGDVSNADLIVFNTCNIREKAAQKVYSDIGRLTKKDDSKNIALVGCVAQAENDEMLKREPYIDFVLGPQAYHKINDTILDHQNKNKKQEETEFDAISKFEYFNKIKNQTKKISSFFHPCNNI